MVGKENNDVGFGIKIKIKIKIIKGLKSCCEWKKKSKNANVEVKDYFGKYFQRCTILVFFFFFLNDIILVGNSAYFILKS